MPLQHSAGDHSCQKPTLLTTYTTKQYPSDYAPTVFDNYSACVLLDGKQVTLCLWDTAGQEDYDRVRPLAYPSTDVFVLCFLLSDRMSLENIKAKWYPELREHAPGIPVLLAGLGLNEWEGKRNESIVAKAEGEALKEEIKVNFYVDRVFGTVSVTSQRAVT
jgi:small GTP-binding protein